MFPNFHIDSKKIYISARMILITLLSMTISCGANVYGPMSNTKTEEALLEAGIAYSNVKDYDNAIASLDQITSGFRQDPRVIKAVTGAYAGKCGLDFLALVTAISTATSDTPLMMMMKAFQSVTVVPSYCYSAQLAMESKYGPTSAARPADINLFMAILGISKMGTYLRFDADKDQNGVVDGAYSDSCLPATISDADVKQVGTGLGLLLDNLTALSAAVSGNSAITALAALQAACGPTCVITNPNSASLNAAAVKIFRSMIKSVTFGIEACPDNPFVTCCP
jgi:hypothetical protein